MTDKHSKSFFGHDTGIIVSSPEKTLPHIFLTCIKRKDDGTWEKTSKGEGKIVKLSIEEIICILEVIKGNHAKWRGYHVFKDYRTEILVNWEDETKQTIVLNIGEYEKKLSFPNLNFFKLLLDHLLLEKIEFATTGEYTKSKEKKLQEKDYSVFSEQVKAKDGLHVVETTEYDVTIDFMTITAKIMVESPKALLISLDTGHELWVPKSTIHSEYNTKDKQNFQEFKVDNWIIEKNLVSMKYDRE